MIALIASALLGLYVFLPIALFDKFAAPFVRLKKNQRTRTEEVVAGILVAAIPFFVTLVLSHLFWHVGHWPFTLSDSDSALKIGDYQTVFNGLYSEHYFDAHIPQFWEAFWRASQHQSRFLLWNYAFLCVEIGIVLLATLQFGRLHQHHWFRLTIGRLLLNRVSEWEPLFTPFVFHPNEQRRVEVDLMTSDKHLYRGTVENHFLGKDGELRGLLLKDAKRFQYSKLEADRLAGTQKPTEQYWKDIPGSNMYVPYDKTVTLNLRYELPNKEMLQKVKQKVESVTGISNITVWRRTTAHEAIWGELEGQGKTIHVKLNLTIKELWPAESKIPVEREVARVELTPMSGLVVDDGNYTLRYDFGGKQRADHVRVQGGILQAQ